MRNRTQSSSRIHGVVLVLIIGFIGTLVALAEQDTRESDIPIPPHRQNETAAAYQRRVSVARNAMAARRLALAEQGANESDIQIPPRRQNETEAAYQRRIAVAKNARAARRKALPQTPQGQLLDKQSGELDEARQLRLQLINKGLLVNPIPRVASRLLAAYDRVDRLLHPGTTWSCTFKEVDGNATLDMDGVTIMFEGEQRSGVSSMGGVQISGGGRTGGGCGAGNRAISQQYSKGVNTIRFREYSLELRDRGNKLCVQGTEVDLSQGKKVVTVKKDGSVVSAGITANIVVH